MPVVETVHLACSIALKGEVGVKIKLVIAHGVAEIVMQQAGTEAELHDNLLSSLVKIYIEEALKIAIGYQILLLVLRDTDALLAHVDERQLGSCIVPFSRFQLAEGNLAMAYAFCRLSRGKLHQLFV